MNFTDAVKELKEGRCQEIEKDGIYIRLYEGCLRCAYTSGGTLSSTFNFRPRFYLADDFKLVGEKPQMGNVYIVRWLHKVEDRLMPEGFTPEDKLGFVKLTGIGQRPIPRKVKRREKLITFNDVQICSGGATRSVSCSGIPKDAKFYAEWEEEAPK